MALRAKASHCVGALALVLAASGAAHAQVQTPRPGGADAPPQPQSQSFALAPDETLRAPATEVLVFSNWYDGLFADSKISGVEIIQRDRRIATNGDVRLAATPGQWDAIGQMVARRTDPATGAIEVDLAYRDLDFRYTVRAEPAPGGVRIRVQLDAPLPAALEGRAGFNLEFLPSAYWHDGYLVDERAGLFPRYPTSAMVATGARNPASGRADGPGAEPLPIATGKSFVLAPSDPAVRVAVESDAPIALYDGRAQAQNGWFVLRSLLPAGRTGTVLDWTLSPSAAPGWLRPTSIGHSQLGYAPSEPKVATLELDPGADATAPVRLLRIRPDGGFETAASGTPEPWGDYLRYRYARFDFSTVRAPGLYVLEHGGVRTAPFRIGDDVYADAWHASLGVFLPVQMDHMFVNEAYRVWHGDSHRDDARQAPLDHEHIDLYRQGPTTDTAFAPGEHIPGLAVGGWLDAGDFDIRTQTQYATVRSLVRSWEGFGLTRDTTLVDPARRRVEIHVPDGTPDLLQQIAHGTRQLVAQFDAVGHAIHGIVEPDVAQYTHLGDAVTKTDGLIYDPALGADAVRDGRSGRPDDRWAFTSRASALNYGSIAALAAASRALAGQDDALASRARAIAVRIWADEAGRAPDSFRHGNTTGGPLESEQFAAAVELLVATGDRRYADAVEALLPAIAERFDRNGITALAAVPHMPARYRDALRPLAQEWATRAEALRTANPYGVPITTGGWAGNGSVMGFGLLAAHLHRVFPELVDSGPVFRALAFLHGNHPGSDISYVSGVGARSKEVAYGNNRADFSFIAGGVVPGTLILNPAFPENKEDWPFLWGENEYVVNLAADYIELASVANSLASGNISVE